MKKVFPFVLIAFLGVALIFPLAAPNTALAEESTLSNNGAVYGLLTFPAPSVYYNQMWTGTQNGWQPSTLPVTFSSYNLTLDDIYNLNYTFYTSFERVGYNVITRIGSRQLRLPYGFDAGLEITGYSNRSVFYFLTNSNNIELCIRHNNQSIYINSVSANSQAQADFTYRNLYGVNQLTYTPESNADPITPISLYVYAIYCTEFDTSLPFYLMCGNPASNSLGYLPLLSAYYVYDTESSAYDLGFVDGKTEGYLVGKDEGISIGKQQGYDEGFEEGKEVGYQEGLVADEPLSAFQSLLVGANQALQTPLFGEGEGAFSIMDFVVIAIGLGLLFWFIKMFAGG